MLYVDLLVIEDLILNYCVLIGTSLLLNRLTSFPKLFLSSVVGTIPLIFLLGKGLLTRTYSKCARELIKEH